MNSKTRKAIRSAMKSHTRSIQDKSRLLVECILDKDPLTANKIFPGLVAQSEALRELEVKKLIFEDDEDDDDDWGDDDAGDDEGDDMDDEGDDEDGDDEGGDEDGDDEDGEDDAADSDTDKVIDDAVEIQCQINAKIIENLFDVIADLKTTLNDKDLDQNSKDFIVLDTTISYYSDKLQELQAQTNPGTDQTKLEEKLDTISKALEDLKAKAGEGGDEGDDVESPEDVDETEQGDDEQSDEEGDEDQEQSEDYQEDQDEGQEEGDEDQGEDEQQDDFA